MKREKTAGCTTDHTLDPVWGRLAKSYEDINKAKFVKLVKDNSSSYLFQRF